MYKNNYPDKNRGYGCTRIRLRRDPLHTLVFGAILWHTIIRMGFFKKSRLNSYHLAVSGYIMVLIKCPHCEEEIELDDDAFGVFQCPYCEGEFEWEEKPKAKAKPNIKKALKVVRTKETPNPKFSGPWLTPCGDAYFLCFSDNHKHSGWTFER